MSRVRLALPELPRAVWILNGGMAVNTFGSGLTAPFLLIYLHNVRGFSVELAGLVPTVHFVVALVFGVISGAAFDRIGGRATAAAAAVLLAVGFGLFPLVREAWQAFALAAVAGAGRGAFWPTFSGLLAALTPPELRPAAYAVQRVLGNAGLALGSLAAGLIVSTSDPQTFTIIFVLSAAATGVFALALAFVPPAGGTATVAAPGTYADVLRDRTFVALVALNFAFVAAGVALLNSVLPLYAKNDVGVGEEVIGAIFVVNTVAIIVAQFPVTTLLRGRRRMPALALMGLIWSIAWALALAANTVSLAAGAALLLTFGLVFALGECIHGVVIGPLVADLAPAKTVGRYMAAWLTTAQLGFAVGPAVGAVALAYSPALLWAGAAAATAALGAASLALESRLPPAARLSPAPPAVGGAEPTGEVAARRDVRPAAPH